MNIIALMGYKDSGKDTVAKYLVKRYNFYHMKFAQYIKDAAGCIFPNIPLTEIELEYSNRDDLGYIEYWEIDKDTPREEFGGRTKRDVLIDLTKYLKFTYGHDIFCKNINRALKSFPQNINIVISDLRFFDEFNYLNSIDFAKVYFLEIERFDNEHNENEIYTEYPLLKKEMLGNLNYEFNIICNNNCLQTFHKMIDKEINRIKLNV